MAISPAARRSIWAKLLLSPEERRLRAGWRILAHFMLLVVLLSITLLLLTPLISAAPQYLFLAEQAMTLLAITLATFIARRWVDYRSITSLGLVWNRRAAQDLLLGIALPGLQMGLIFLAEWAFGWLRVDGLAWKTVEPSILARELLLIFLAFVAVGWQEELLSRGYWLQNLEAGLGLPGALLVSSLLFALGHLLNPNISLMALVGLTAAGLFLAYGYLTTRQLWLPIGLHIGWNFFEGPIFGFPVSGITDFFTLLGVQRSGPNLLTGGAFGPEAGLLQYPVLLLAVWIIYRCTRSRQKQ